MNIATPVLSTLLACSLLAPGVSAKSQTALRFARVADSARVYNLPDTKGKVIAEPKAGSVIAVHREHAAGWIEVEIPGGFAVWVFGRYLKPTALAGIYEVTGNAVNMRPEPNSDPNSFPLPQRLQSRDQVAVIGQLVENQPMDTTWVRIWSPPGVRGLMRSDQVRKLAAGDDGPQLWSAALAAGIKQAPAYPPPGNQAVPAVAPITEASQVAKASLESAKRDLDIEAGKQTPDFGRIRDELEAAVKDGSGTAVAIEAKAVLQRLGRLEETLAMKEELYRVREKIEREALEKQEKAWERSREIDPLREVFLARGVLERRIGSDGQQRYFLRFGLETRAELLCSSRRYDFSRFADYEIGVKGTNTGELEPGVDRIDVVRVEVLKRR